MNTKHILFLTSLLILIFINSIKPVKAQTGDIQPTTLKIFINDKTIRDGYYYSDDCNSYIEYFNIAVKNNSSAATYNHVKFRLIITLNIPGNPNWELIDTANGKVVYSHVHTVDMKIPPGLILTSEKFEPKVDVCGKLAYWIWSGYYTWTYEVIKVW
jgi:hypothetical protein